LGVLENKVEMVPNGCDINLFKNRGAVPKSIAPRSKFRCIYAGTFGAANGLEAVVEAASLLQLNGDDRFEFLLVGDGSQKDFLQQEVRIRGVKQITFHPFVSKPELAAVFSECDLGLQILKNVPEFYEGTSPNKFFDYIAAGLPVLINYPGWVERLIATHKLGVYAPPNDPKLFLAALDRAYRSKISESRKKGRFIPKTFLKQFSRENLSNQCVDIVESVFPSP
jgi:glycosyltransferase involved in cell wall biosynthesis